jgi:hypothetical protein
MSPSYLTLLVAIFKVILDLGWAGSLTVTPDGCPYPYDLGKFNYEYKRPRICATLLPDDLATLPAQTSKKPFNLSLEALEDSDNGYYDGNQ